MDTKILIVDCSKTAIRQIKQVVETVGKFSILEYLTKSLTRKECDYTIMEVQKLVREEQPAIIVTRIAWPGFDKQGFRLCARIKQEFPDIIIIGINEPVKFWEDYMDRVCNMDHVIEQPEGEIPFILGIVLHKLKSM